MNNLQLVLQDHSPTLPGLLNHSSEEITQLWLLAARNNHAIPSAENFAEPLLQDAAPLIPSLLIVDDDPQILAILLEIFSEEYRCTPARTVEEALNHLPSQNYDVIITDISMPGLSGEDLLGFIKKHNPKTPVIIITGSPEQQIIERLLKKGAFDYLQKPFSLEEMERRVVRALAYSASL